MFKNFLILAGAVQLIGTVCALIVASGSGLEGVAFGISLVFGGPVSLAAAALCCTRRIAFSLPYLAAGTLIAGGISIAFDGNPIIGAAVVLLYAILGLLLLPRAESLPEHCCRKCGYDLRGLPAAHCPECGEPRR